MEKENKQPGTFSIKLLSCLNQNKTNSKVTNTHFIDLQKINSYFNISSNILSCFLIKQYLFFNKFITSTAKSFGVILMKPACIVFKMFAQSLKHNFYWMECIVQFPVEDLKLHLKCFHNWHFLRILIVFYIFIFMLQDCANVYYLQFYMTISELKYL